MNYIYAIESTDTALSHHGTKGQKWGIRRYQNPDGSLTEAGRKRYYGKNGGKKLAKDMLKDKRFRNAKDDYELERLGEKWLRTFKEANQNPYDIYNENYDKRYNTKDYIKNYWKIKPFKEVFEADNRKSYNN